MQKRLVIIADDFTGANDTGVQYRKLGLQVKVIIDPVALYTEIEQTDVLVIDLESRLLPAADAYNKTYAVGTQLYNIGNCTVFKKLDSTFRGNIGAEIDGLMDAMQLNVTFLAAAWPSNGRTIEKGEVYVHNRKLADTEANSDPRTPVKHSGIANIIGQQSKRVCQNITTYFLQSTQSEREEYLVREITKGVEVFILDSSTEKDLEEIALTIGALHLPSFLIAGSAGLANHLSKTALFNPRRLFFVFAGSISENTSAQIHHALEHDDVALIFLEAGKLLNGYNSDQVMNSISASISEGKNRFIFTAALTRNHVAAAYQMGKEKQLSPDETAGKISKEMGKMAAILIQKFKPVGVLLTGGETAINTVLALGATGIQIDEEMLPGVQSGKLTGCSINSSIVTKAGAFGGPDTFSKIFQFFNA